MLWVLSETQSPSTDSSSVMLWGLQVNHSPSFSTDAQLDREIKGTLIWDTLGLINFGAVDRRRCLEEERKRIKDRLLGKCTKKETKWVSWLLMVGATGNGGVGGGWRGVDGQRMYYYKGGWGGECTVGNEVGGGGGVRWMDGECTIGNEGGRGHGWMENVLLESGGDTECTTGNGGWVGGECTVGRGVGWTQNVLLEARGGGWMDTECTTGNGGVGWRMYYWKWKEGRWMDGECTIGN